MPHEVEGVARAFAAREHVDTDTWTTSPCNKAPLSPFADPAKVAHVWLSLIRRVGMSPRHYGSHCSRPRQFGGAGRDTVYYTVNAFKCGWRPSRVSVQGGRNVSFDV